MRQVAQVMEFVWMSSVTVHRDTKAKHALSEHVLKDVIPTEHVQNLESVYVIVDSKEIHAPRHLERQRYVRQSAVEKDDVMWLRVFVNATSDSEISTAAREYARLIRSTERNAVERVNATQIRRVNARPDSRELTVPLQFANRTVSTEFAYQGSASALHTIQAVLVRSV